jgi:hypothetical protein
MHAVRLHNCTPHPAGQTKSLYTLFTDEDPPTSSQDYQVFGSPVYVLDSSLQSGNLGPGKWKNRCHQGVYIGHSLHHASNVILVYNPKTRLVSPQYHVVHDEIFDTVQISKSEAEAEANLEKMLDELFISARWQHTPTLILTTTAQSPIIIILITAGILPINKPRLIVSAIMKIVM